MNINSKYGNVFNSKIADINFIDVLKKSTKDNPLFIGIFNKVEINKIVKRNLKKLVFEVFKNKNVNNIFIKFYKM